MLSESLRKYRNENKLSQVELCEKLSIPRQRYASYEEGRAEPSIQEYFRFCELMNVDPVLFYNGGVSYYQNSNTVLPKLIKIQSYLKKIETILINQ